MSKRNGFMMFLSPVIMLVGLSVLLVSCSSSSNGTGLPPTTYAISGTVSGEIRQSVNIAVSGAVNANVATDANGNYSVSGLPSGSYTITPSKAGYTFTQASKSVVISGADSSGNDFTSTTVLYAVTGTVSGAVQAGVTITVSGTTETGSAFTSSMTTASGSYSVPNVPNGSYTVTPARTGYSFSPVSVAVTVNAGNAPIAAFTSAVDSSVKFNLTGAVSGAIKAGVTINVTGAAIGSASTLADGTYTISNLPNGSYTVSASRSGYTFGTDLATAIDGADSSGNNFVATALLYSISGTVSGDLQTGVTITVTGTTEGGAAFGPIETSTSGDGSYSVPGVPNGVYTVIAAQAGYLFNPLSYAVTITAANSPNRDFLALATPVLAFRASGGTGSTNRGGDGGEFYAESYGSIKVLKSGTVDASFTVPPITTDLGAHGFTVNTDTTVPNTDDTPGALCQESYGDGSLYIGDGNGFCDSGDTKVTGLTIAAGATLVLFDSAAGSGSLRLTNDLVINGTLTSDLYSGWGFSSIEANLIEVGSTGKITASATAPDSPGGEINIGQEDGLTRTIVNRGTIEAKGNGNGYGGYIYFEPRDLVVNYGRIDVSGGSSGGSGGEFDAYVDYGNFYSSGTVLMNGGNGDTGGHTEYNSENWYEYSCWIETAFKGNTNGNGDIINGDIIISGIWEAKGGNGANGSGGSGGQMSFQTDGMGNITVNAYMSVKGGNGTGSWADNGGRIYFVSNFGEYSNPDPGPGKISIAGIYDLRGGDSDQDGGGGGDLQVLGQSVNSLGVGSDVEFVGFSELVMNGGGGQYGGNASDNAFQLYTYAGSDTAKSITNEADIQAKGGDATQDGGMGGYVTMQIDGPGDAKTVLNNSGNIDVSGGEGETGGSAYDGDAVSLLAEHVYNSGDLTANGGNGTINGGNGSSIYLEGQHVDNSGSIMANGGNGTGSGGIGGDGGYIYLNSDAAQTYNTGTLSVIGGAGDSAGNNGTVYIDGSEPI
jgi:hypothetical protein